MRIRVHHRFADLADEWDKLATEVGAWPFCYPGWFTAWWDAFGEPHPRRHLRILAVRDDDDTLAGVLPMYRQGATLHSLSNAETPLFDAVTRHEAAAAALARHLADAPAPVVVLDRIDPGRPLARHFDRAARERRRIVRVPVMQSPFALLDADWETYLTAHPRARRIVTKNRRHRRRLEEEVGPCDLVVDRDTTALDAALRLEASGWKGDEGTAILSLPETERFYRALAAWAQDRGWLRLTRLASDGRLTAFQYGLHVDDGYYYLKSGYDERLRKHGPGVLMDELLVRHWLAIPDCDRFEFLGGDEEQKLRWADGLRERERVAAYASDLEGTLGWSWHGLLRPRLKRLRDGLRERRLLPTEPSSARP